MKYFSISILFILFSCSHNEKRPTEQIEMTLSSNENNEFKIEVKNLSIPNMKIHMGPPLYTLELSDGRQFTLVKFVTAEVSYMINNFPIGSTTIFDLPLNKKRSLICYDLINKKTEPINLEGATIHATKKLVYPNTWEFFNNRSNSIPFPNGFYLDKNRIIKKEAE